MALTQDGGVFAVLNAIIENLPGALGRMGGKIAEISDGLVAGVSEMAGNIGSRAASFSLGGGEEITQETPKLGLNARKMEMAAAVDTSAFAANFNDIQVPTIGAKGPMSAGIGV